LSEQFSPRLFGRPKAGAGPRSFGRRSTGRLHTFYTRGRRKVEEKPSASSASSPPPGEKRFRGARLRTTRIRRRRDGDRYRASCALDWAIFFFFSRRGTANACISGESTLRQTDATEHGAARFRASTTGTPSEEEGRFFFFLARPATAGGARPLFHHHATPSCHSRSSSANDSRYRAGSRLARNGLDMFVISQEGEAGGRWVPEAVSDRSPRG